MCRIPARGLTWPGPGIPECAKSPQVKRILVASQQCQARLCCALREFGGVMNRLTFATLAVVLFSAPALSQKLPVTVRSPDGRIVVKVERNGAGHLTYAIERNGETVIAGSQLRLRLAEGDVSSVDIRGFTPRSVQEVHKLVATKAAEAVDRLQRTDHRGRAAIGSRVIAALDFPCLRRRRGVPLSRARRCGAQDAAGARRGDRIHVRRRLSPAMVSTSGASIPVTRVSSIRSRPAGFASTIPTICHWCAARPAMPLPSRRRICATMAACIWRVAAMASPACSRAFRGDSTTAH